MGLIPRAPLPVDIDFVPARVTRWYGWALLAAGLWAAGIAYSDYRTQQAEVAERETIIGRLRDAMARSVPSPRGTSERSVSPEEAKAAAEIAAHLNAPWGGMFAGVASAQTDAATWILFDADASRKSLRITGDARNMTAVFGFLERLDEASGIRDVRLSSYEWTKADDVAVVRFHAVAAWGEGQ